MKTFSILVLSFLVACSETPKRPFSLETPVSGNVNVYIYSLEASNSIGLYTKRPIPRYANGPPSIYLEGNRIGKLRQGEYVLISTSPGFYTIRANVVGISTTEIDLEVNEDDTNIFISYAEGKGASIGNDPMQRDGATPTLHFIDEVQALNELKETKQYNKDKRNTLQFK